MKRFIRFCKIEKKPTDLREMPKIKKRFS